MRSCVVANAPSFYGNRSSFLFPQDSATCSCVGSDDFTPSLLLYSFKTHFNIILRFTPMSFKWSLSAFPTRALVVFLFHIKHITCPTISYSWIWSTLLTFTTFEAIIYYSKCNWKFWVSQNVSVYLLCGLVLLEFDKYLVIYIYIYIYTCIYLLNLINYSCYSCSTYGPT